MKKIVAVITGVALVAISSAAFASKCNYHKWRGDSCRTKCAGTMAKKCEYFQWKWNRCMPEKPVVKAVVPKVEKIVLRGVNFDTASAKIKHESFAILDNNVAALKKTNKNVVIVGYTDSQGKEASNIKLSQARANSVKAYFESKGIDASRISTQGMGPANPVADNKTAEGRAENRRIELELK